MKDTQLWKDVQQQMFKRVNSCKNWIHFLLVQNIDQIADDPHIISRENIVVCCDCSTYVDQNTYFL
jgi:hypothetical protein